MQKQYDWRLHRKDSWKLVLLLAAGTLVVGAIEAWLLARLMQLSLTNIRWMFAVGYGSMAFFSIVNVGILLLAWWHNTHPART